MRKTNSSYLVLTLMNIGSPYLSSDFKAVNIFEAHCAPSLSMPRRTLMNNLYLINWFEIQRLTDIGKSDAFYQRLPHYANFVSAIIKSRITWLNSRCSMLNSLLINKDSARHKWCQDDTLIGVWSFITFRLLSFSCHHLSVWNMGKSRTVIFMICSW